MPQKHAAKKHSRAAVTPKEALEPTSSPFDEYFETVFGFDRWHASLKPAMAAPPRHASMRMPYTEDGSDEVVCAATTATPAKTHVRRQLIETASTNAKDIMEALFDAYVLDVASIVCACALGAQPGEKVLDMCSAPGGKALALATDMFPWQRWVETDVANDTAAASDDDDDVSSSPRGSVAHESDVVDDELGPAAPLAVKQPFTSESHLTCSEASAERRQRLARTLREHLPSRLFQWRNIRVANDVTDGAEWAHKAPSIFHRVLLDAPCTSERHLVRQAASRGGGGGDLMHVDWSVARCRRDAERQVKLLMAALRAVRVGGVVVYATCSISPAENDAVVRKVLMRCATDGEVEVCEDAGLGAAGTLDKDLPEVATREQVCAWMASRCEMTPCGGRIALPDRCDGFGPLFWCRLLKIKPIVEQRS
ncbi:5-methylcytosine rRNA methyltransferase NSUN4 [Pseudoscourfieldia marina]